MLRRALAGLTSCARCTSSEPRARVSRSTTSAMISSTSGEPRVPCASDVSSFVLALVSVSARPVRRAEGEVEGQWRHGRPSGVGVAAAAAAARCRSRSRSRSVRSFVFLDRWRSRSYARTALRIVPSFSTCRSGERGRGDVGASGAG